MSARTLRRLRVIVCAVDLTLWIAVFAGLTVAIVEDSKIVGEVVAVWAVLLLVLTGIMVMLVTDVWPERIADAERRHR